MLNRKLQEDIKKSKFKQAYRATKEILKGEVFPQEIICCS